jgi:hypothetical protein
MRHVPRKIVRPPLRLSRPLLLLFAAVIACSALIGAVSALNQGSISDSVAEGQPRGKTAEARRPRSAFGVGISNSKETAQVIAIARASLEGTGFAAAGNPVRYEQDMEIPVRDSEGHIWTAWLDRSGRTSEIEIVDYDEDKVPEAPAFNPQDLPRMIAKEGFQARGEAERRPEHFEIRAVNKRSELVDLHIDFAGQIYKQVWIR